MPKSRNATAESVVVNTRLRQDDHALVEAWASLKGVSKSAAIRQAVLRAAREDLRRAVVQGAR